MKQKKGRPRKIQDLELAFLLSKGLSQKEISLQLGVHYQTVKDGIKRLRKEQPELLELASIEDFRKGESDDIAGLRRIILGGLRKKLTTMSLSNISLSQLGVIYGILFEKDRLLRGEATEHIATATYNELDDKTRAVIGDAVKQLTSDMLQKSRAAALDDTPGDASQVIAVEPDSSAT